MALAASANMAFNILIGDYGVNWLSSDDVLGTVGTWWFLFCLNCLWTLPFVIFMLPETKSLTLEEMHNAFDYTFGGDLSKDLGTMVQYVCKNAGQAADIVVCRKADIYAGFDKEWRMGFVASAHPGAGEYSPRKEMRGDSDSSGADNDNDEGSGGGDVDRTVYSLEEISENARGNSPRDSYVRGNGRTRNGGSSKGAATTGASGMEMTKKSSMGKLI